MATFKDQILSISGTIEDVTITDSILNLWTNQAFGEVRTIVPDINFEPLVTEWMKDNGDIKSAELGQHVGEFNKIVSVYCALYPTWLIHNNIFVKWMPMFGYQNVKDATKWPNDIPKMTLGRELPVKDFLENNHTASYFSGGQGDVILEEDYTSQLHYNTGTPLDPVWTRMQGGIRCAPHNFYFKVLYVDTPNFKVTQTLGVASSGFTNIPSELRNLMSLYVGRQVKLYELDSLTSPNFEPSITINPEDYLDSVEHGLFSEDSGFSQIISEIMSDSEGFVNDEDVELATASLKAKTAQLETLKSKVGSLDTNLGKKIAILQNDVAIYQQALSRYQQRYTKLNKDLEQLTLKYNEAVAAMNGQTFAGKASKTELDKIKQELANLKNQLGRGKKR